MITAAVVAYYVFAIGLLVAIGYFTGRRINREMRQQTDEIIARMRAESAKFPPLEPYMPEPIPDDDELDPEDEYADTIASVRDQLADLADHGYPVAAALKEVDVLARQVGV